MTMMMIQCNDDNNDVSDETSVKLTCSIKLTENNIK